MSKTDFTFSDFLNFLEDRQPDPKQAAELRQVRSLSAPAKTLQKYLSEYRALSDVMQRYDIPPERIK